MVLLESELKYGKRWVEIKKKLKGRSENSIKNRYNTLYKRYLDENKTIAGGDVNDALEAAIKEDKSDEKEWIRILLEQKKNRCIITSLPIAKEQKNLSEKNKVANQVEEPVPSTSTNNKSSSIIPESNKESSSVGEVEEKKAKNFGQYTCPNLRYINRFRQRKRKFIDDAELFINPVTHQKVYVSDQGIFLLNSSDIINPLASLEQIKKSDQQNSV